MLVKVTSATSIKALSDPATGDGAFEAIVATYDTDSVGDKIAPGAFEKSLADWKASGRPIPVVWSHQHANPFAHIGEVVEAAERPGEGLWIKAQLDMENATARQVFKLMKGGRVDQFSFAYDVVQASPPADPAAADAVTTLQELKVYEVGPTLIGANQETRLLAIKSGVGLDEPSDTSNLLNFVGGGGGASWTTTSTQLWPPVEQKVGRVLSAKNEEDLRGAHEAIGRVLAQIGKTATQPTAPAKAVARSDAPAEEPNQIGPDADPLVALIHLLEMEIH